MLNEVITPIAKNANIPSDTYTGIYTLPINAESGTVSLRVVSQDPTKDIKVRMAIVQSNWTDGVSPPPDNCWICPIDIIVGPSGIKSGAIEDTGIVLSPGETIVVYSDIGFATARVHGFMRAIGA